MADGLQVFNAAGDLVYSSADVTWNQVDFFKVTANGSASKVLDVLSGRTVLTLQMFINPPPPDRKAIAHTITVSGTTVSVSGGTEDAFILVLMR